VEKRTEGAKKGVDTEKKEEGFNAQLIGGHWCERSGAFGDLN